MTKATYISLLTSILLSCNDEVSSEKNIPEEPTRTYLVSAESVGIVPLTTLTGFAQLAGQEELTSLIKYSVETFKIVYETTFNNKRIKASGLLYIPQNLQHAAPLISLQHGTTFVKENAPSTGGGFTGMEYFASAGYIALMPDYIGYGESAHIFHPYYDKPHSALVVIDMIHSVKEFLTTENIGFNDQLFLAGYSEGGYVTLAAAEEIENNTAHNLTVTAIAAGAGGYNLTDMLHSVITQTHYAHPSYLAFVLMAYNTTYEWNKPLSYFFQDRYATALATYMNGEYEGWQINSRLTTRISDLLDAGFLKRLKQSTEETTLKIALAENSIKGWQTSTPIQLYHGTNDEIIPYENSAITLDHFKQAGSEQVNLTIIPGGTHGNTFIPMLKQFVPWFESFRNNNPE